MLQGQPGLLLRVHTGTGHLSQLHQWVHRRHAGRAGLQSLELGPVPERRPWLGIVYALCRPVVRGGLLRQSVACFVMVLVGAGTALLAACGMLRGCHGIIEFTAVLTGCLRHGEGSFTKPRGPAHSCIVESVAAYMVFCLHVAPPRLARSPCTVCSGCSWACNALLCQVACMRCAEALSTSLTANDCSPCGDPSGLHGSCALGTPNTAAC